MAKQKKTAEAATEPQQTADEVRETIVEILVANGVDEAAAGTTLDLYLAMEHELRAAVNKAMYHAQRKGARMVLGALGVEPDLLKAWTKLEVPIKARVPRAPKAAVEDAPA